MLPVSDTQSQMSSRTAETFPSNDYLVQLTAEMSNMIQNGQIQELTQLTSSIQIPPVILTQFLSSLIDNPQNIEIIKLFLTLGADVNAVIHSSAYQIEEREGITLLMYL